MTIESTFVAQASAWLWVARARSRVFLIGFGEILIGFGLRAAGVVIGFFGFAVFVDGALALPRKVEDLAEINVGPGLHPFITWVEVALGGFAEGVGGGLVVLLVEEGLAHAEVGERIVLLDVQRALVLLDSLVVSPLFGYLFAAGTRGG